MKETMFEICKCKDKTCEEGTAFDGGYWAINIANSTSVKVMLCSASMITGIGVIQGASLGKSSEKAPTRIT